MYENSELSLKIKNILVKFLTIDQMLYLEQMYARLTVV